MRTVPRGREGMCLQVDDVAKATLGLVSWTMCFNSERVDRGLAGEIVMLRERSEK